MSKKRKKTYEERIVAALRETWRKFSPERKAALARQKIKGVAGGYICEHCNTLTTDAQCDHVVRVGIRPGSRNATTDHDWNGYIDRLNSHRLQILCKTCHKLKTKQEDKT